MWWSLVLVMVMIWCLMMVVRLRYCVGRCVNCVSGWYCRGGCCVNLSVVFLLNILCLLFLLNLFDFVCFCVCCGLILFRIVVLSSFRCILMCMCY